MEAPQEEQKQLTLFDQVFNSQQIDVLKTTQGKPAFVTSQICQALDIKRNQTWVAQINQNFDAQILGIENPPMVRGKKLNVITFEGVTEICYRSQSPLAKQFRDFITDLVLSQNQKNFILLQENTKMRQNIQTLQEQEFARNQQQQLVNSTEFDTIFNGKKVNILGTKEEPVFIVKEICDLIGLDTKADIVMEAKKTQGCDSQPFESQLRKIYQKGSLPSLINEEGLYDILFRSNKPLAKQFKHHIFFLLKDIRLGNIKLLFGENSLLKHQLEKSQQQNACLLKEKEEARKKITDIQERLNKHLGPKGQIYLMWAKDKFKSFTTKIYLYVGQTLQGIQRRFEQHKKDRLLGAFMQFSDFQIKELQEEYSCFLDDLECQWYDFFKNKIDKREDYDDLEFSDKDIQIVFCNQKSPPSYCRWLERQGREQEAEQNSPQNENLV